MQIKATCALKDDAQVALPVRFNRKEPSILKQRMKASTTWSSAELGGKIDSAENKEEQADMGLNQLQTPPEVLLHLLHVITGSSFQPTCGDVALLDK